jgi:hypothetical protein
LLHFVAFSGVASLFVIGVDNRKVRVDNSLDPLPVGVHFRLGVHFWLRVHFRSESLLVRVPFRSGSTSHWVPLPVGVHFRLRPKLEVGSNWKWAQTGSGPKPEEDLIHPKMQQNILLHSSMITPDIGLNSIFCCLKMKYVSNF